MTNSQKTGSRRLQHLFGHHTGTLQSTFQQNSARTTHVTVRVGQTAFECYCPVLRSNEIIDSGSVVMFQRNVTNGRWEIFSAECPEE
ncbi:MAG: hypothetical protein PHQ75_08705 [Thermoguttaceae bacterium]|nr:hypothetical protein [Thermoguttaceae bacterium]